MVFKKGMKWSKEILIKRGLAISKTTKGHKVAWNRGLKGWNKGHFVSNETRDKISKALTGKIGTNKGKKFSDEWRKNMAISKLGDRNPAKRTDVKIKMSKARKGKKLSEEHKRKIALSHKGEKCNFWKGGISFESYGFNWTKVLRHSIRIRDYFTCKICKKRGWSVHHIDYDKKNNDPKNLVTLCINCHGKTNFNREYWTNYFQNSLTL